MTQRLMEIREEMLAITQEAVDKINAANAEMTTKLETYIKEMSDIEAPDSFKGAILRDVYAKVHNGIKQ